MQVPWYVNIEGGDVNKRASFHKGSVPVNNEHKAESSRRYKRPEYVYDERGHRIKVLG